MDDARPAECVCLKTLGRASCHRGHGYCPFLDPGGRNGDWEARYAEQVAFYREHEPWRLWGRCSSCFYRAGSNEDCAACRARKVLANA